MSGIVKINKQLEVAWPAAEMRPSLRNSLFEDEKST